MAKPIVTTTNRALQIRWHGVVISVSKADAARLAKDLVMAAGVSDRTLVTMPGPAPTRRARCFRCGKAFDRVVARKVGRAGFVRLAFLPEHGSDVEGVFVSMGGAENFTCARCLEGRSP